MDGRIARIGLAILALLLCAFLPTGRSLAQPCHGDLDGDRRVSVAEVILAVNHLLYGCPGSTPTPSRPPQPTATPGTLELQILQAVAEEVAPNPGQFGCTASPLSAREGSARLTCELPVAFAFASIDRHEDASAAAAVFEEIRGSAPLSEFHGYDAFETTEESIGLAPSMNLYWRAERWVFRSTQVTAFENITVYHDIAESVFAEAVERGLLPAPEAALP